MYCARSYSTLNRWPTFAWHTASQCLVAMMLLVGVCRAVVMAEEPSVRDIVIADFEGDSYGEWMVEGEAFGTRPAPGTLPGQMEVSGFVGAGLVNSFVGGDGSTGSLTSPPFSIERDYLSFLIGGGGHDGQTCLQLHIDGASVLEMTGPNRAGGGSERLISSGWDLRKYRGQEARLVILDRATGGWGHINVDQIVLTDKRPAVEQINATREITLNDHYLLFPVGRGLAERTVTISSAQGERIARFTIELPGDKAGVRWWAPVDVAGWQDQKVTVTVDRLSSESQALDLIHQVPLPEEASASYDVPLRPRFHFSAQRGWLNDPNGLVYYDGEYHLFFQHNPYGTNWGNMHWGHAVSPDLVHWTQQPDKLVPDDLGMMFSGSAVIDWKNTSGLGRDDVPPMILYYTAAGAADGQCLAYSVDRGRTVEKWAGNPALPRITPGNRDPKVFWHEPSQAWIMVLYVGVPNEGKERADGSREDRHTARIFRSSDLKSWEQTDEVDDIFECPDLFPLLVDGQADNEHWVLFGADGRYFVGHFDGYNFVAEGNKQRGHKGRGFYAAQTYSDIPATDGRRILIGWLQAQAPEMPFNQCMSVPLELGLVSTPQGPRLTYTPARELKTLEGAPNEPIAPGTKYSVRHVEHRGDYDALGKAGAKELQTECTDYRRVRWSFTPSDDLVLDVSMRGVSLKYDRQARTLRLGDHEVPLVQASELSDATKSRADRVEFDILLDATTIELFTDGGRTYVPLPQVLNADKSEFDVTVQRGSSDQVELDLTTLRSAWQ